MTSPRTTGGSLTRNISPRPSAWREFFNNDAGAAAAVCGALQRGLTMAALRIPRPDPAVWADARDLYVVDGLVTYEPQAGAELVAKGWIVPGLVDAHCHLGLDDGGAISKEETEAQAITDRDAGALLIRDCGSASTLGGSNNAKICLD
ncbi:MAG: hypothetical protein R2709_09020 [Marmoricola sp.]